MSVLQSFAAPDAVLMDDVDLYRERFVECGWKENVPYDGIHEALETIAAEGHLLFVATAKPHMHAARIVEHFGMGDFFHNVYGSELDGTRATKTELLRFAIEKNPGDAARVIALVGVEILVLGGNEGVFDQIGDLIGGRINAALFGEFVNNPAFG